MQVNTERYLTYEQAASILCMSTGGLRNRMCRGEPMPPSVKIQGLADTLLIATF